MNARKLMFLAVFALTIVGNANSAPKNEYSDNKQKIQTNVLKNRSTAPLIWESNTQVAQSLPDCSTMDGNYCSTPGTRARCYWYQYQEPMVCVCQSNNVWFCN